jgi:secreted trypsin-like serine protease
MTAPVSGPQGLQTVAGTTAVGPPPECADCAQVDESDTRLAIANLSRKYTDLAEAVAQYVTSEAEGPPEGRSRTALSVAGRIARIVGGFETQPGEYPDCALIGRQYPNGTYTWFCTGVLVQPRVVLTAAHCYQNINVVALDAVNFQDLQHAEIIGVRKVAVNPLWTQGVIGNDIAVLVLRQDAGVAPIALATQADLAGAGATTLVGFGNSDTKSTKGFGTQREVTVDILHLRRTPQDDLDAVEHTLGFESDREFVAGGGGYDSCNGDSGGPAYISVGSSRKVAGLTSRGTLTATSLCGEGGIYTRVDTQRAFIDQVLNEASAPTQPWSPSSLFK